MTLHSNYVRTLNGKDTIKKKQMKVGVAEFWKRSGGGRLGVGDRFYCVVIKRGDGESDLVPCMGRLVEGKNFRI